MSYKFDPETAYNIIEDVITQWATTTNTKNFILGISGGKDSTVVAMLLSSIFGKEHVHGVMLPCGEQADLADSVNVINILGINGHALNIGDAFTSIIGQIDNASYDTKTNLPARLRMAAIFALGQTLDAKMINTCNLSEDMVGYATLFGDCAGCFAPIQDLTVTEIRALGKWLIENKMELDADAAYALTQLVDKTPIDGLQPLSDEDKLGFTYETLDKFIRNNEGDDEFKQRIWALYKKNKFKLDIVRMVKPHMPWSNYVSGEKIPHAHAAAMTYIG